MPDRASRERAVALGAAAAGGALVVAGGSATWHRLSLAAAEGFPAAVEDVGAPAGTTVLGLVALASVAALPAARGHLRRAVGAALLATGVVLVARTWAARSTRPETLVGGADAPPGTVQLTTTPWPWVTFVGAALVVVAGVLAAHHGHRWSGLGTRYTRQRTPAPRDPARTAWDELDAGRDPTG